MKLTSAKKPTTKVFAQDGEATAWITVEMTREEITQQTYQVTAMCTNCGKSSNLTIQKGIALEKVLCPICEVARFVRVDAKGKRWYQ